MPGNAGVLASRPYDWAQEASRTVELEDPGTFVARVEQAKARKLQQGTSHR